MATVYQESSFYHKYSSPSTNEGKPNDNGAAPEGVVTFGNRVIKFMKSHDGRDKAVKIGACGLELFNGVVDSFNVLEDSKHSRHKGADILKNTRTVTGLLNIFGGVLKGIYLSILKIIDLVRSLFSEDAVCFAAKTPDQIKINVKEESISKKNSQSKELFNAHMNTYKTTADKLGGIAAESSRVVGGLAYTAGFGICRPILFAGKLTELSKNAKNVGSKFGFFMLAMHTVSYIPFVVDTVKTAKIANEVGDTVAYGVQDKMISLILDWAGNTMDLAVDIITLFCHSANAFTNHVLNILALVLNFAIAMIDVVKVWRETA